MGISKKGRPNNIDSIVSEYDELLSPFVTTRISLKDWDESEIKTYTIDNIHFTKEGFKEIVKRINYKIRERA